MTFIEKLEKLDKEEKGKMDKCEILMNRFYPNILEQDAERQAFIHEFYDFSRQMRKDLLEDILTGWEPKEDDNDPVVITPAMIIVREPGCRRASRRKATAHAKQHKIAVKAYLPTYGTSTKLRKDSEAYGKKVSGKQRKPSMSVYKDRRPQKGSFYPEPEQDLIWAPWEKECGEDYESSRREFVEYLERQIRDFEACGVYAPRKALKMLYSQLDECIRELKWIAEA